jgi:signal transduction histidine kinase
MATPQVVPGAVGHIAALLGAVWLAPLATALLGMPNAVPARHPQRAAAAITWARALPVLAGIGSLTAVTGACLAAAAIGDNVRHNVRVPRLAAAVLGVLLAIAGVLQAVAGRGSFLEPLIAVSVAGCGMAFLVFRPAQAVKDSSFAGLVVELGQTKDALSLERRLARAVGDPQLRLLYQLSPGLPFVDASGSAAAAPAAGRIRTVMGQSGPVVAALEHDRAALDDPKLREAILAVGRLAVRRLMRASEAAQQSVELAESRGRLVEAERAVRRQFASDVANGPGQSLARCLAVLDVALAEVPAGLLADVAAARAAASAAGAELARLAAEGGGPVVGEASLTAALLELAGSAGADTDVRIDGTINDDIAAAAWFAASEALANALKHAGPARIWLRASTDTGFLQVEVADDGIGGADPEGNGLRGLARRLEEHGGSLRIHDIERPGTRVVALLPLVHREPIVELTKADATG